MATVFALHVSRPASSTSATSSSRAGCPALRACAGPPSVRGELCCGAKSALTSIGRSSHPCARRISVGSAGRCWRLGPRLRSASGSLLLEGAVREGWRMLRR
eukprot:5202287-Pyramimonas_sp.AAC.1